MTNEQLKILNTVPFRELSRYYASRKFELRESGQKRICGHIESHEKCPNCRRADGQNHRKFWKQLNDAGIHVNTEGELKERLQRHLSMYEMLSDAADVDSVGFIANSMDVPRRIVVAAMRYYGLKAN